MSDTNRYIPEHRRHQHKGKNQFRGDELRRRREDQQVEIRKLKKEENLAKRRNLDTKVKEWDGVLGDTSESDEDSGLLNRKVSAPLHRIEKWMRTLSLIQMLIVQILEEFPQMVAGVFSDTVADQLVATAKFRKILSKERNPPIERVIECGVIPRFVEFLSSDTNLLQVTLFLIGNNSSLKLHGR
jgi:importin subunit alpha-6/7